MCCACCRPGTTHDATTVAIVAVGLGAAGIGVAWLVGVIVAVAPLLWYLLIATLIAEIVIPTYVAIRDSGSLTVSESARMVMRAIAVDVRRIRLQRARRRAALEQARTPIAMPYLADTTEPERVIRRGR